MSLEPDMTMKTITADFLIKSATEHYLIPLRVAQQLADFAVDGVAPGHFVRAVLENNLYSAFAHADRTSKAALPDILAFVLNRMPAVCHSTEQAVEAWIAQGGMPKPK